MLAYLIYKRIQERDITMQINLLTFSEALDKMKSGNMPYMIRMKWLEADYLKRVVLLYKTNHIALCKSSGVGSPDELWIYRNNEKSGQSGTYANLPSSDILADDWLDLDGWNFAKDVGTYRRLYQDSEN